MTPRGTRPLCWELIGAASFFPPRRIVDHEEAPAEAPGTLKRSYTPGLKGARRGAAGGSLPSGRIEVQQMETRDNRPDSTCKSRPAVKKAKLIFANSFIKSANMVCKYDKITPNS